MVSYIKKIFIVSTVKSYLWFWCWCISVKCWLKTIKNIFFEIFHSWPIFPSMHLLDISLMSWKDTFFVIVDRYVIDYYIVQQCQYYQYFCFFVCYVIISTCFLPIYYEYLFLSYQRKKKSEDRSSFTIGLIVYYFLSHSVIYNNSTMIIVCGRFWMLKMEANHSVTSECVH